MPTLADIARRVAAYPYSPLPDHLVKKKRRHHPKIAKADIRDGLPFPVISERTQINTTPDIHRRAEAAF